MTDEEIIAQVSAILDGWTETPGRALASRVGENWLIGGFIDGTCFYKHTGLAPDGPDTPDDPIEAAHWLVAHVAGLRSPAPSGVFDSEEPEDVASAEPVAAGPDLGEPQEIGGHDASPDIEPDEVGDSVDADLVDSSGDWSVPETDPDAGPGDPDYSVSEPVGDVASVADEPEAEAVAYPGMMIAGDALASAKAIALMKVDDERYIRVGDYDKSANQTRLDELRQIQQAIREGVHPPFTDEQAEELQALETFLPFIQRIDDHAQGLRNAIREAADLDALAAIDLEHGWPE